MSDGTALNAVTAPGGDTIDTEDPGGGAPKIPRSKIVIGVRDTDGGDVSGSNPMPVTGSLTITGTPNVAVTNFPATQPVSAVALPLPSGAAADATLTTGGQKAQQVDGSGNVLGTSSHPTRVDPVGTTTQPVSAAALPLPTGAATDANITSRLGTVGQKVSASSAPVVIASDQSAIPVSGSVTLVGGTDGLALDATLTGATAKFQQSDGTNTLGTPTHPTRVDPTGTTPQPITATSLPLPTGAAQDATLTGGTAKTQVVDAGGHVLPAGDAIARSIAVQANDGTNVIGTSAHPTRIDPTGSTTQPISAASLPLPAGAALDATLTVGTAKSRVTDGTNTAAVKAASTGSRGNLDPALVVAVSHPTIQLPFPQRHCRCPRGQRWTQPSREARPKPKSWMGVGTTSRGVTSRLGAFSSKPPRWDQYQRGQGGIDGPGVATDPAMVVAISPNGPATVVGAAAVGAAVSGNPVLMAGKDPSGNAQDLNLATDKSLLTSPKRKRPSRERHPLATR